MKAPNPSRPFDKPRLVFFIQKNLGGFCSGFEKFLDKLHKTKISRIQ